LIIPNVLYLLQAENRIPIIKTQLTWALGKIKYKFNKGGKIDVSKNF